MLFSHIFIHVLHLTEIGAVKAAVELRPGAKMVALVIMSATPPTPDTTNHTESLHKSASPACTVDTATLGAA